MSSAIDDRLGAIVLAGNAKIKRQIRRRKRKGFFYGISRPELWTTDRGAFEANISSRINKDDYIVGENKSLLFLHPDLISQKNLNFLKRALYFAGKTGDRFYRKNKRDLLQYLSKAGETSISLVMRSVQASQRVSWKDTVIIGPKPQLDRELERSGLKGTRTVEQSDSIGDNILKGKQALIEGGYHGKRMIVLGGDLPLLTPGTLDDFILACSSRGGNSDINFGMGSRQQLARFIEDQDLTSMGSVGPNYPKKGNLNKFGIPLIDDIGLFGARGDQVHFMMGNVFIMDIERMDRAFIDRFYSLRKMYANPLTYPYLLYKFGRPLFRAMRWKVTLSEAERIFRKVTKVDLRVAPVSPSLALDLDSYSDLRRLSALYFHSLLSTHDLEMDFKVHIREKRAERRRSRRNERRSLRGKK